ncbi:acyl-CoA dehydrogenase [uncultured Albimonas sp.]|uniref:acyl-CoA dehydrogenase family protein n=1 Tax=uncultured Albimonas sp. TaxID=1331701 RepID=UPI0030EE5DDB|tara:strand:- start:19460 stop:20584 length:1125 start_codon:yes stop_codon:yes gene_type:complete
MNFEQTDDQTALADSLHRWMDAEHGFETAVVRAHSSADPGMLPVFAELGWLGAALSEAEGGFGGGAPEAAIVGEAVGRALVVEPWIPLAVQTPRTLLALAGEAARPRIEALVSGERRLVPAVTETAGRGAPDWVETRAERDGDGWRLTGTKSLVLGAPLADAFLVAARLEGAPGDRAGVALFETPAQTEGLSLHPYRLVDRRAVADLDLADVRLPAEALIGPAGGALEAIELGCDHARLALCAEILGAMDAALWMTRDYLRTREQFGRPIGDFQALQHRMAEMLVETELTRSMIFQGLAALGRPPDARAKGIAATKAHVARSGLFVGRQAIQLHGGMGMTEELKVGHLYRRIMANAGLLGDADLHVARYAEMMD